METYGIEKYGFKPTDQIFRNNPPGALVEKALLNGEGRLIINKKDYNYEK